MFDFTDHSHRRYNLLTDQWVLVLPHRAKRPWQGAQEEVSTETMPEYDPKCYLCPGNERATGPTNPEYTGTFVFPNDYPAVKLDQPEYEAAAGTGLEVDELQKRLFQTQGVRGKCFVICFSPNHGVTLPLMLVDGIAQVVDTWQQLYRDMQAEAHAGKPFRYLQIFENKGAQMGCSNPHPHGQAWCLEAVPTEVAHELAAFAKYAGAHGSNLLADYAKLELATRERVVVENDLFVAVVPYWATWPFETMVLPKTVVGLLAQFLAQQKRDLAELVNRLTIKYDNLFKTLFPYLMGLHQEPLTWDAAKDGEYCFHMHFYPPLLRSATVRKFLVGFEMLGEAQRDLTPEQAAARLRELPETHYKSG